MHPVVIGLTGGVASGKSTVAEMFQRLGAVVLDGDRIGHEVLCDSQVESQIRDEWGESVFKDGVVDRRALGAVVFGTPDRKDLKKLEAITHPKIKQRILEELSLATEKQVVAVVLDAPLLLEAGWDELCDKVVFVHSRLSDRLDRASSRGWSDQELERREQHQVDLQLKRQNSADTIDNSSSLQNTFSQAKGLWMSWGLPVQGGSAAEEN